MQPLSEQQPYSPNLDNQALDLHTQNIRELANHTLDVASAVEGGAQLDAMNRAANALFDNAETTAAVSPQQLAQQELEAYQPDGMGEESRALAVQLNKSSRTERGLVPLDFESALAELAAQSKADLTSSDEALKQEGLSMSYYTRSASREPTVSDCNSMLTIIESNLSNWAQSPDKTPLHNEQVEAWRGQRDAIWQKRAELAATQQIAERQAAEQPEHDAAVQEAQSKVAAAIEGKQPVASEISDNLQQPTAEPVDVTRKLGETWARLNRYVPDKQFSAFARYQELPAEQQQALANDLWDMYREATTYKGDIKQRSSDMAEKFDALAAKYAVVEASNV